MLHCEQLWLALHCRQKGTLQFTQRLLALEKLAAQVMQVAPVAAQVIQFWIVQLLVQVLVALLKV